jgi:hypothetical protein
MLCCCELLDLFQSFGRKIDFWLEPVFTNVAQFLAMRRVVTKESAEDGVTTFHLLKNHYS